MSKLSPTELAFLREFTEGLTGSVYDESKNYLFETRLVGLAKEFDFSSTTALVTELRTKQNRVDPKLLNAYIEVVTTHETLFFRDRNPFKILQAEILPQLKESIDQGRRLDIYSAACSTGQESVSLVIACMQTLENLNKNNFRVLATDIAQRSLDYASEALYTQYEIQRGMPVKFLNKYFTQEDKDWRLKPEYRELIQYQQENLLEPRPKVLKFDVVFCRNVTIYMDEEKVRKVREILHSIIKPGGYLIVGHSENMSKHSDLFKFNKCPSGVYYQRVDS